MTSSSIFPSIATLGRKSQSPRPSRSSWWLRVVPWLLISLVALPSLRASVTLPEASQGSSKPVFQDPAGKIQTLDWSGIGRDEKGRWVTMISDRHFLTSNHHTPRGRVTFYPSGKLSSEPVLAEVAETWRLGKTDLRVGALTKPLPQGVAAYPILAEELTNQISFQFSDLLQQPVLMVGNSPAQGDFDVSKLRNMAVGINLPEAFGRSVVIGDSRTDSLVYAKNRWGDLRFVGPGEAQLAGGDSGAPSFVLVNGELALVGIHAFIGELPKPIDRQISGDNFLPNYVGLIREKLPWGTELRQISLYGEKGFANRRLVSPFWRGIIANALQVFLYLRP